MIDRPLLTLWCALAFMGCTGLLVRAFQASDAWYSGSAAAWVQAIGSILAVAGAAGIAVYQAAEQRRLAATATAERAAERVRDGNAFVDAAQDVLGRAEKAFEVVVPILGTYTDDQGEEFRGAMRALMKTSKRIADELTLLATRAPTQSLVAELVRCSSFFSIEFALESIPSQGSMKSIREVVGGMAKALPGLRERLDQQRL